jgi:hypothetical protein
VISDFRQFVSRAWDVFGCWFPASVRFEIHRTHTSINKLNLFFVSLFQNFLAAD